MEERLFNKNPKLSELFSELAESETGFKANALRSTALLFKLWPYKITADNFRELSTVKGVGKGTLEKLTTFFEDQDEEKAAPPVIEEPVKSSEENKAEDSFLNAFQGEEDVSLDTLIERSGLSREDALRISAALAEEGKIYNTLSEDVFSRDA